VQCLITGTHVQVNEKCDIYALGIMLWECLTGTRPFSGMQAVQVMCQIMHRQQCRDAGAAGDAGARDWLPLPRRTPPDLAALVRQCWHDDKEKRCTADEARARLPAMWPILSLFRTS
jgi:serine/threonine protein kinase